MVPVCGYTGHHPAETFPDAEAPPWIWLCHLAKENIGCRLEMWGGFIVMVHLRTCVCSGVLCAVVGEFPSQAVLFFPCFGNAKAHHTHKQAMMCQPRCCADV